MNCKKNLLFATIVSSILFSNIFAVVTMDRFKDYISDSVGVLKEFIKAPIDTSAITASSPWVVDNIIKEVGPGKILEVGAGPGNVTCELIKKLKEFGEDYNLDVVEPNEDMFKTLSDKVDDLGIETVNLHNCFFCGDQCPFDVHEYAESYDTIISTIPITRLPKESIKKILTKIKTLLKPGGKFIYISFWAAETVRTCIKFLESKIKSNPVIYKNYLEQIEFTQNFIDEYFSENKILITKNLPPTWIHFAIKK